MIASKWQVEWVGRDGVRHTRLFKYKGKANRFASSVDHAPWNTPEIWPMS